MAIIYPSPTSSTKSARRFGSGILASLPSHKTDYTSEDASWWAAQLASIAERDSHLDQMALEAEAVDRLVSSCCL